jgi:tRNA A37 N6-isopentenylltransferase MiaA
VDFTEAMVESTELIEAAGVAIIVLGGTHGLLRALQ